LGIENKVIADALKLLTEAPPLPTCVRCPWVASPSAYSHRDDLFDRAVKPGDWGIGFLHDPINSKASDIGGGVG
jgi:hypothetical protein